MALMFAEQVSYYRNFPVLYPADMCILLTQGGFRGMAHFLDQPSCEIEYKGLLNYLYCVMRVRNVSGSAGVQVDSLVPSWSSFLVPETGSFAII